jgi:hypothetical protein
LLWEDTVGSTREVQKTGQAEEAMVKGDDFRNGGALTLGADPTPGGYRRQKELSGKWLRGM